MTKPKYKIGVLGTGHLIQHLVPGLLNGISAAEVLLSPRNAERAAALRNRFGCAIAGNNAQVVDLCEIILVAVRPFQVEETITDLPWRPEQTIISLCAGVRISVFARHLNGAAMVRALPVTAAEFGESPTCIYPNDPVAIGILAHCGPVLELKSEDDFEVASIMGAYYGWVQALIGETAGWLHNAGLDPDIARRLTAAMTLAGATTILERPETEVQDLVDELCLPGSITGLGLDRLKKDNAFAPWQKASTAVLKKLRELD